MRKAVRDPFAVGSIADLEKAMTKDSKDTGIRSLKRLEFKPTPMKFADESHPIFSNPTVITFGPSKTFLPKGEGPRSALEDMMSLSPEEIKEVVDLVLSEEAATEEAPNRTIISWIQDCITALRDPKKILQKLRGG